MYLIGGPRSIYPDATCRGWVFLCLKLLDIVIETRYSVQRMINYLHPIRESGWIDKDTCPAQRFFCERPPKKGNHDGPRYTQSAGEYAQIAVTNTDQT